jgi:hypothetical protein
MKIGSGASGGKLLDQLDWIKSMTNVTGVLHILIGTYELLNFRNLSGQASRRGLDLHFPRYLFQHEQDRQDFQGVLLALLKQVPLTPDPVPETVNVTSDLAADALVTEIPLAVAEPAKKKSSRRVGQRNPQRDPVG